MAHPQGDIVVTWPKTKPLWEYLRELERARKIGYQINFRVSRPPRWDGVSHHHRTPRCYMVHDGAIRGWCPIIGAAGRDDVDGWPSGFYIIRSPEFHPIEPIPMRGFQGWRWLDPSLTIKEVAPTTN